MSDIAPLGHRAHVDEMVRHPRLLHRRRFRGTDIHATIKQQRIARYDFRPLLLRPAQRPFRLADRRRPREHMEHPFHLRGLIILYPWHPTPFRSKIISV